MRTHYRNGDDIRLQHSGCDGCSPSTINGVLCHESGCTDAWRDEKRKCKWCGYQFSPTARDEEFCDDSCYCAYNGIPTDDFEEED